MNKLTHYTIPPLANEDHFEDFCRDLYSKVWSNIEDFKRFGRRGQSQHGIDIAGKYGDQWWAIQCKQKGFGKQLTESEIQEEVNKAKEFIPKLSRLLFTTTAPRDAKVQTFIRMLSEQNASEGYFKIEVDAWDDIINHLDNHRDVFEKYFPDFFTTTPSKESKSEIIPEVDLRETIPQFSKVDDTFGAFHVELDAIKKLLEKNKPATALELLHELKERCWELADNEVKFRILTNIGSAELSLNRTLAGAKSLIEAFKYKEWDEKALLNMASAQLILQNRASSREYALLCLKKYPNSKKAYSLLLQLEDLSTPLDEIVKILPDNLRRDAEMALTLSHVARQKGDLDKALEWAKQAYESQEFSSLQAKEHYGCILIEVSTSRESMMTSREVLPEDREKVSLAERIFFSLINDDKLSELRNECPHWFANLITTKLLLGKTEEATRFAKEALIIFSNDSHLKFVAASALIQSNSPEAAIEALESNFSSEEDLKNLIFLSEIYFNKRELGKCEETLRKIELSPFFNVLHRKHVQKMTILLLLAEKKFSEAQTQVKNQLSGSPFDVLTLILAAKVERALKAEETSLSYLQEALKCITNDTPLHEVQMLAHEFYDINMHTEAELLFEKAIAGNVNHPDIRILLDLFYQNGKNDKAEILGNKILANDPKSAYVTEYLSAIYEETGDLERAKEVCRRYLGQSPNNFRIRIRLGLIYLREGNKVLLEQILRAEFPFDEMNLRNLYLLSKLYLGVGKYSAAVEVQYRSLKNNFTKSEAHSNYIFTFLAIGMPKDTDFKVNEVAIDTYVKVEYENGQFSEFVIIPQDEKSKLEKEIIATDETAKMLLGKRLGDVIEVERFSGKTRGRIVEVMHKHVYTFRAVSDAYSLRFPTAGGFEMIKAPSSFEDIDGDFKNMLQRQEEIDLQRKSTLAMYKNGSLTLGALSKLIGSGPIDVYEALTTDREARFLSLTGRLQDCEQAAHALLSTKKISLDATSLLTIFHLEIQSVISHAFDEIHVSQSTIDTLNELYTQRSAHKDTGMLRTWGENGKLKGITISKEQVQKNLEFIASITAWIKDFCKVGKIPLDVHYVRDEKEKLGGVLGPSFLDSILISKYPDVVFVSDDLLLRQLADSEFGVKSASVKDFIDYALKRKAIDKSCYTEKLLQLINMNFTFIGINAEILIEAFRRDNFSFGPLTHKCLRLLGKDVEFHSALVVCSSFMIELWRLPLNPRQRDLFLTSFLDIASIERDKTEFAKNLIQVLYHQLRLSPLEFARLKQVVDLWINSRLVV